MKGENLKFALGKKKISQRELAEVLECSVNTVWRWCNDKQEVSDKIKKRLSEILCVPISYLMGESEDYFLRISDKKKLSKELAPYFGETVSEPGSSSYALEDSRSVQTSVHDMQPLSVEPHDDKIIFETGIGENKKRYILPATPEAYDFLKQLHNKS